MQREKIENILSQIVHPELKEDLVKSGIASIEQGEEGWVITLRFRRQRDPWAGSLRNRAAMALAESAPEVTVKVVVEEPAAPAPAPTADQYNKIGCRVAIASGKGGVGKSSVTANLAVTLRDMGYRVGILDADIYGPSQPKMFGVEGHQPEALIRGEEELILPAEKDGIKIMSIGFFVDANGALVWRGPMATSALRQMVHQTLWEELDFLLIDLPPGTGDIHLSVVSELKVDGAVVVTTPQQVAVADVRRGITMFRSPKIDIPVWGLIENMAWFTPEDAPEKKYYIFGKGGGAALAEEAGVDFLGELPIIPAVAEGGDSGVPAASTNSTIGAAFRKVCEKVVEKGSK